MTTLALLRHGPTAWNIEGRLQGRADIPLGAAARRELSDLRLPSCLADARWVTSPLRRAVETARCLGASSPETDERLIEMDWGAWEGRTLGELRARLGASFAAAEARGLDLRPPRGESPRQVQQRLRPWLREVAAAGTATVAVTHKGVIRAVLGLACDWDFLGPPPAKPEWPALQVFALDDEGHPRVAAFSLRLVEARQRGAGSSSGAA